MTQLSPSIAHAFLHLCSRRYVEIVRRTASLVAHWQAQGWCHGVLNTDNMSLLGLTLDYGPFGWMDRYDPSFICNASDNGGRYSYENQPAACRWNCNKLGEMFALSPAIKQHHAAQAAALRGSSGGSGNVPTDIEDDDGGGAAGSSSRSGSVSAWDFRTVCNMTFSAEFQRVYQGLMRRKLGLGFASSSSQSAAELDAEPDGGMTEGDLALLTSLLDVMQSTGADYSNTFRALMDVDLFGSELMTSAAMAVGATDTASAVSSSSTTTSGPVGASPGDVSSSAAVAASDPVLAYLLTQTASAAEMREANKPQVPLAQLRQLARMAEMQPGTIDLEEVQREMRKHEAYARGGKKTDAEKAREDAAAWSGWLADYRRHLTSQLPDSLKQYAHASSGGGGVPLPHGTPDAAAAHAEIRRLVGTRVDAMRRSNPKYVLRNWVAHKAIAAAEAGDYSEVSRVLQKMLDPFGLKEETCANGTTGADLCSSHVRAPNTAVEGASHMRMDDVSAGGGGMTVPPSAAASGGGSCARRSSGGVDYSSRPPPELLDLKVT